MIASGRKIEPRDLSFFLMAVATISFHDQSKILVCAQLLFIMVQFLKKDKVIILNATKKYLIWGCSFSLYALMSYIWAVNRSTVLSCAISIIQVILIGAALINYCNSMERRKKALEILMIAGLILCARLLVFVPTRAWGSERVGNYIGYGNVTVTYSLSYIAILIFYEGYKSRNKKYVISSVIMMFFSALSGSKKAIFVALISIVAIVLLSSTNLSKRIKNCLMCIVIVLIGIYCLYNVPLLYNAVGYRIDNMILQLNGNSAVVDKSTLDRMLLIQYAKETFLENPILGVGLDAFRYINPIGRYAHNNYMELLACLGIVGTLLYYCFPIGLLIQLSKRVFVRKRTEYVGLLATLVSLLFMDIASVSYSSEPIQITIALIYSTLVLLDNA